MKSAVRKHFSYSISEKVKWNKNESQWDITEKIDGIFSGIHEFELLIDDTYAVEEKLKLMSKNWTKGQFPTKLLRVWTRGVNMSASNSRHSALRGRNMTSRVSPTGGTNATCQNLLFRLQ